jgi:hypothetical protein
MDRERKMKAEHGTRVGLRFTRHFLGKYTPDL